MFYQKNVDQPHLISEAYTVGSRHEKEEVSSLSPSL